MGYVSFLLLFCLIFMISGDNEMSLEKASIYREDAHWDSRAQGIFGRIDRTKRFIYYSDMSPVMKVLYRESDVATCIRCLRLNTGNPGVSVGIMLVFLICYIILFCF